MLNHLEFANPEYFYLFLLIPVLVFWYWFRRKKAYPYLIFSNTELFEKSGRNLKVRMMFLPFLFRLIILSLLFIVLARPQSSLKKHKQNIEGIDIMMALDISSSMLAEDFSPNRLEAAKEVATRFINGRSNDRIGLVLFSGEAFTQCPLTSDHARLKSLFNKVESGIIDDGTALGDGLATAINRIRNSKAISKVIILLTDGVNNMGSVDPLSAADIAKLYGVRVYTIGVGTIGQAPYPFKTPFGVQYQNVEVSIDEQILSKIAKMTGGKYYRATGNMKLNSIFKQIDKLEKSRIDVLTYEKKSEEYAPFLLAALLFFIVEIFLRYRVFSTIP